MENWNDRELAIVGQALIPGGSVAINRNLPRKNTVSLSLFAVKQLEFSAYSRAASIQHALCHAKPDLFYAENGLTP